MAGLLVVRGVSCDALTCSDSPDQWKYQSLFLQIRSFLSLPCKDIFRKHFRQYFHYSPPLTCPAGLRELGI